MRPDYSERVTVSLGEGVAVFRRNIQSRPIVANILGVEKDAIGEISVVYLDRVVHKPKETSFEGWHVSGAIVTEMRRMGITDRKENT